jgi:catechol 2,3-dioxygenase-like lactoylglutathione lyase family enzyme
VQAVIQSLDTVELAASSPGEAMQDLATLFGLEGDGEASFRLANVRLTVAGALPSGEAGLAGLTFAVDDLAKSQDLLGRRGLRMHCVEKYNGGTDRVFLATDSTHGVPLSLMESKQSKASEPEAAHGSAVSGLDHIVIRTPNPERAVALYAGRLGLSLRLDRSEPSWGARLMFFRCGDLIVEVAHDLKAGIGDGPDKLWGLSWRVPDAAQAHARLKAAGAEVSDLRTGRRPGTRVFTVRSHAAGVPTIMIGADAGA